MSRCCMLALAVILFAANVAPAQDKVKKATETVQAHIAKLGGRGPMILAKGEAALAATFPDHVFVIVRFRLFPVAMVLPEGLRASNIFVVAKDEKLEHIQSEKALEKFFQTHQKDIGSEEKARKAAAAWLILSQEFHQDGMFKFEVLDKEFGVEKNEGRIEVRGRALVVEGGKGELAVSLAFEKGTLTTARATAKVFPGPRPICQATKLLDPDPIVRKMAEQDLLFMGLAARDYIMEQRDKAGPELRRAIEQLWDRIVKNGW